MRKPVMFGTGSVLAFAAMAFGNTAFAGDRKPADPNDVICEKQTVVGSRLATKRICLTRAQWIEQRRVDRQDLDKAQHSRGLKGE